MIVGIAVCLMAPQAWGQETQPLSPGPWVTAYPLELLGLLSPAARRGPLTLVPSVAVSEEYNDNLFFDNQNRRWDLITGFSPAIMLSANRPTYQLSAGYSFTAEMYERESRLNDVFNRQNFVGSGSYQPTPRLTLFAYDTFTADRNTNRLEVEGFATGRQESWSNTFTPGTTWEMTPRTSLSLYATYSVLRFKGAGPNSGTVDSDTYGLQTNLGHVLTPRLTGTIGYGLTYLDFHGQGTSTTTNTPTLGVSYRLTPTLTAAINGGAALTELGGKTLVSPAGSASLLQTLRIGSASVRYIRNVSVAGGFGGTTDTQSISGALTLPTWRRDLVVAFSPTYSTAESVSGQQAERVNARAFTLNLGVTYQIARFVSVFGGYSFLQQRTGGSSSLIRPDVDQSRARFGLQFGYPISFD